MSVTSHGIEILKSVVLLKLWHHVYNVGIKKLKMLIVCFLKTPIITQLKINKLKRNKLQLFHQKTRTQWLLK